MTMKDIYDDDSASYHHLYSYMNQLVEATQTVMLCCTNTPTHKGSRVCLYLFVLISSGLTTVIMLFFRWDVSDG